MTGLITITAALISIYIVFALLVSRIVEVVSSAINMRGRTLFGGIEALLGSTDRTIANAAQPIDANGTALTQALYAHPLISTLGGRGKRKPEYIAARTFTLTLISILRERANTSSLAPSAPAPTILSLPSELLNDLRDRVILLAPANSTLAESLSVVLEGAGQNYEDSLCRIDAWFNAQMDRVSGIYRRWSGYCQAVIAAAIVGVLDLDTIRIVEHFAKISASSALTNLGQTTAANSSLVADLNAVIASGLQIGWPSFHVNWFEKLCGLLLTWGAIMLGAPFWFDVLKQIVPVRSTGSKPAGNGVQGKDAQSTAN